MSMFKRVAGNTEQATAILSKVAEVSGRTNYNELVLAFNALSREQGDFLMFPWKRDQAATLSQNLNARGLVREVDFTLGFVNTGTAENPVEEVIVRRISDKTGTPIAPAKRGPKVKTEKAEGETKAPAAKAPAKGAAK